MASFDVRQPWRCIELVLHVFFRPFRDNTVGLSQALSAVTNLAGVLTAALPFLAEAPEWMNPGFLMFISVAGTSVQLVQAMMDPIFKGTTFILSLAGAGSPVASTTEFGKTARAFWDALKTRFGKSIGKNKIACGFRFLFYF